MSTPRHGRCRLHRCTGFVKKRAKKPDDSRARALSEPVEPLVTWLRECAREGLYPGGGAWGPHCTDSHSTVNCCFLKPPPSG